MPTSPIGQVDLPASARPKLTHIVQTVHYVQTLPTFEAIVTGLLGSLGDRNWLMGAVPATQKIAESDNTLQHFVADMMSGLVEQLEARARGMRKLVAAIFLLNNRKLKMMIDVAPTGLDNVWLSLQSHTH